MTSQIDELGGAAVGREYSTACKATFPLAHLWATNDHIRFRFLLKRYTLPKAQVSAIRRYDGLFLWRGVQIIHTVPECPSYMVFYPASRRETVVESFRQLGYKVLDDVGKQSEELS